MTQEKLADALGLTFQQLHNYETGTSRIGPATCNISHQFSKSQSLSSSKMHSDNRPSWTSLATMSPASSPRRTGFALTKAYMHIENAKLRRSIVALVKQIAGEDEPDQVTLRII
jgi:transcriptional regulator with XRE-family HTH domain